MGGAGRNRTKLPSRPCLCGFSDSCRQQENTVSLCPWLRRFGRMLANDPRRQRWFRHIDVTSWLEQLRGRSSRSWTGRTDISNNDSQACGRRNVLVRHLAYRRVAELQRGRAVPERFDFSFAVLPRNDTRFEQPSIRYSRTRRIGRTHRRPYSRNPFCRRVSRLDVCDAKFRGKRCRVL